jgi:origin recognition complex subunit 3
MEDEKCYVFKPSNERPSKRRRVTPSHDASWSLREALYQESWSRQHARLQNVIEDANRATFDEILGFLNEEDAAPAGIQSIKAGYVLAGPDTTSHATIFTKLGERVGAEEEDKAMVTVRASDAPNLKTLLKVVIRKVLDLDSTSAVDSEKLLDYDLKAVHLWMQENEKDVLVLGIVDSEAFQASVLADFIELLR